MSDRDKMVATRDQMDALENRAIRMLATFNESEVHARAHGDIVPKAMRDKAYAELRELRRLIAAAAGQKALPL